MEFVSLILPMAVASVDRLEEIPDRLRFLFDFDPAAALATREVEVIETAGARDVVQHSPMNCAASVGSIARRFVRRPRASSSEPARRGARCSIRFASR